MKFDPSLPRDGINVGRTHPLRELALLRPVQTEEGRPVTEEKRS